jgi:hypothetical protein
VESRKQKTFTAENAKNAKNAERAEFFALSAFFAVKKSRDNMNDEFDLSDLRPPTSDLGFSAFQHFRIFPLSRFPLLICPTSDL